MGPTFHLRPQPSKFFQQTNLHICITSSPFGLLATPTLRPSHSITLDRPSTSSSQRITDSYFQYAPRSSLESSRLLSVNNARGPISPILIHPVLRVVLGGSPIGSIDSPLSSPITPLSLFHSRLKTFLFCISFLPYSLHVVTEERDGHWSNWVSNTKLIRPTCCGLWRFLVQSLGQSWHRPAFILAVIIKFSLHVKKSIDVSKERYIDRFTVFIV